VQLSLATASSTTSCFTKHTQLSTPLPDVANLTHHPHQTHPPTWNNALPPCTSHPTKPRHQIPRVQSFGLLAFPTNSPPRSSATNSPNLHTNTRLHDRPPRTRHPHPLSNIPPKSPTLRSLPHNRERDQAVERP